MPLKIQQTSINQKRIFMYRYNCGAGYGWGHGAMQQPPANIQETDREYILNLYAPSLKKEAISITTKGDVLSIKYNGDSEESERFTRKEFHTNAIYRSFDLKGKVNVDDIHASYSEGILKIILPKTGSTKTRTKCGSEVMRYKYSATKWNILDVSKGKKEFLGNKMHSVPKSIEQSKILILRTTNGIQAGIITI